MKTFEICDCLTSPIPQIFYLRNLLSSAKIHNRRVFGVCTFFFLFIISHLGSTQLEQIQKSSRGAELGPFYILIYEVDSWSSTFYRVIQDSSRLQISWHIPIRVSSRLWVWLWSSLLYVFVPYTHHSILIFSFQWHANIASTIYLGAIYLFIFL